MQKIKKRFLFILPLILLLALIRNFENQLFYDPFLSYFKSNFQNLDLPDLEFKKLFFGLLLRFTMNTIVSLAIIYVVFKNIEMVKFAMLMYVLFFMILIFYLFWLVIYDQESNKMHIFYTRRFLIQPLLLLLFLPGFYLQNKFQNKL